MRSNARCCHTGQRRAGCWKHDGLTSAHVAILMCLQVCGSASWTVRRRVVTSRSCPVMTPGTTPGMGSDHSRCGRFCRSAGPVAVRITPGRDGSLPDVRRVRSVRAVGPHRLSAIGRVGENWSTSACDCSAYACARSFKQGSANPNPQGDVPRMIPGAFPWRRITSTCSG